MSAHSNTAVDTDTKTQQQIFKPSNKLDVSLSSYLLGVFAKLQRGENVLHAVDGANIVVHLEDLLLGLERLHQHLGVVVVVDGVILGGGASEAGKTGKLDLHIKWY